VTANCAGRDKRASAPKNRATGCAAEVPRHISHSQYPFTDRQKKIVSRDPPLLPLPVSGRGWVRVFLCGRRGNCAPDTESIYLVLDRGPARRPSTAALRCRSRLWRATIPFLPLFPKQRRLVRSAHRRLSAKHRLGVVAAW